MIAQKESGQSLIGKAELMVIDECWRRDHAPVTVRDVWRSVYNGAALSRQAHFAFGHEAVRTLTSSTGSIEALFNELWEPDSFVEVSTEANGEMHIVKGAGYEETINGKTVWVINKTVPYRFDVQSQSMLRDFFSFIGFTIMPDESGGSLFTDVGITKRSMLFERSFWRVSREPDGLYYCAYGVYQPSRFGDTHFKILGRAKGEDLKELLLKARDEFLANNRIFKPVESAILTLRLPGGKRKIRVNRVKMREIGQNGELLEQLLFHLESINGQFLRMEFDPVKMTEIGRLMLKSFIFMYGGFCDIRKRALSWALVPVHALAEFGPMAAIAIGTENITGIDVMKSRYKYNRQLVEHYENERKQDAFEQMMVQEVLWAG